MIPERTKAALRAAKARGIKLGRNGAERLAPAYRAAAVERAQQLAPILAELNGAGLSARQIAAELTARDCNSRHGTLARSNRYTDDQPLEHWRPDASGTGAGNGSGPKKKPRGTGARDWILEVLCRLSTARVYSPQNTFELGH